MNFVGWIAGMWGVPILDPPEQPFPLEIGQMSYECRRCQVKGYSQSAPHVCWCCDRDDELSRR